MKTIFGLDLGTTSIGWAAVQESENHDEQSVILDMGVRLVPLSQEDTDSFTKKDKETAQGKRTLKRSMRRNLQRYKLRRDNLISVLKSAGIINDKTILAENGSYTTFQTLELRAKAVNEQISLEEFARVLLAINKKRGYKSSRKYKTEDEGAAIDSIDIAKRLYNEQLTPGQLSLQLLNENKKKLPDYYRSDLQEEFDRIWETQAKYHPTLLTTDLKAELKDKTPRVTWAILENKWVWTKQGQSHKYTLKDLAKRQGTKQEIRRETISWRVAALDKAVEPDQLAYIFQDINSEISRSSGYLGRISDRSKQLSFGNITVGQFLINQLKANRHTSLKNQVFYRQDYMDEFDRVWETQAKFYPQLTAELKHEIRDIVIFYQRRLKSQKHLINYCQLIESEIADKTTGEIRKVGPRVAPRSSPMFQQFKIWQSINDIIVTLPDDQQRPLTLDEKTSLANELSIKEKLTNKEIIAILFGSKAKGYALNVDKSIQGDTTGHNIYLGFSDILEDAGYDAIDFSIAADEIKQMVRQIFQSLGICTDILTFNPLAERPEREPYYQFWQLLYSFEDDAQTGVTKLIKKLEERYGFDGQQARILTRVTFVDDYGNISVKAIKKILPYMMEGLGYSDACAKAGLNHSKSSITKADNEARQLLQQLPQIAKNSLRNPTVEKILNQMVNVINALIAKYGHPDEIRVELARELKKNKDERIKMTESLNQAEAENNNIRKILMSKGLKTVGRNDIIRWKLYQELATNGYKTLYSDKKIDEADVIDGKNIDIEHIIPQSLLFDDSISNKTLEYRDVNINKGNMTAIDFVKSAYGEAGLTRYINTVDELFKDKPGKQGKYKKLMMHRDEIPTGFIDRDLRQTQYISRKALEILHDVCRQVIATTGSITDRLREDWQLIDVMKEISIDKYRALGMVEEIVKGDKRIVKIKDWTKRNDHRHHALDALTVAFTNRSIIQYLNTMNATDSDSDEGRAAKAFKDKYVVKGRISAPMPLNILRAEAKKHIENILISVKAKNKVATKNHRAGDTLTPRGPLHNETFYGKRTVRGYEPRKIDASFDSEVINTVADKQERKALARRLAEFGGDPAKAFTKKNAPAKNPIWLDEAQSVALPDKVNVVVERTVYVGRKDISEKLNIAKVLDHVIRKKLSDRLAEFDGDSTKAFSNLDENPIWFDRKAGIAIKRVTIDAGIASPVAIHDKCNHLGERILSDDNIPVPSDYVATGSNHHVALFVAPALDKNGKIKLDSDGNPLETVEEHIVSFFEAVERIDQGLDIIDYNYNSHLGWKFLMTIKANEYFIFPDIENGFNPREIDLTDPKNRELISPHLYRCQKMSSKYYCFRHHLDTSAEYPTELQNITWIRITMISRMKDVIKVRLNQLGQIIYVGE